MESASDRSPDPTRSSTGARPPRSTRPHLLPISSPGPREITPCVSLSHQPKPPARLQGVSPAAGSGRGPGRRSNHQELLGRQDVRTTRPERDIAERP